MKHKPIFVIAGCCLLLLVALLACGGSDANIGAAAGTTTTQHEATATRTPAPAKHFKANQVVTVGDTWKVTINSVTTNTGSEYLKPKEGHVYLLVDVSLVNVSSKEQDASSSLMWHLRDLSGQEYDETYTEGNKTPEGKVEAGSPLRGVLSYEIPQSQKKFTLSFEANFLDDGQTIWDLNL